MAQAVSSLARPGNWNLESEGRDPTGFWLSILLLCLLPLERIMLPFSLKVADMALVLLTLHGLVRAWRTHQRLVVPLLLPIWLILLSSAFATMVGFAHPDSVLAIVQEVYLFTWFIVLANVLKGLPSSSLDRLMKIWSVIALAEATATVMGMLRIGPSLFYTSFFTDSPDEVRIISAGGLTRAVGTYVNPNAVAAYLSTSFFVLLATCWPVWLRSVFGMWLLAGMAATGSMGASVSTIGGLAILVVAYSVIKNRQAALSWGVVVGMGLGALFVVLLILDFGPSLLSAIGLDTSSGLLALTVGRLPHSVGGRLARAENSWPIYNLHPWGTGPAGLASLGLSLHNDYLAFLFERGPAGLVGWLWLVGTVLLVPLRVACRLADRHHCWQAWALGAGFLAAAMNAFSHEVSHFRHVWLLMAFLFAVSYIRSVRPTTGSPAGIESVERSNGHDIN